MTHPVERPELPSKGELWSILLGALLASTLLVSAFRLSVTAQGVLADEEAEPAPAPSVAALDAADPRDGVVVRPEPPPRRIRRAGQTR